WRSEFDRLEGAYAPSTMRAYYSDVQAFVDWCQKHGHLPFPAEVDTVCAFIEDQGREMSASTVRRRLYAIRKIHRLLRLEDPTYDEDINLSLRRVRRSKLTRPKQARGITADDLALFLASEPDTPTGLRNRAMMALGFELLTRRSELVALRDEDLTVRPDGTLQVMVRRSKADPFGQGRIAFTSKRTAELIDGWQTWRGSEIPWLFCPIYKDRPINRVLETTTVRRMIKAAALRTGYTTFDAQEFSGHSLRVGAAQELLRRGHDTAAIMRAGGWKSVQVLARYLEKAEHNVWS
ncbi:MAG: tyrosine-type recombinase/integrase, partial [Marivita sp.]